MSLFSHEAQIYREEGWEQTQLAGSGVVPSVGSASLCHIQRPLSHVLSCFRGLKIVGIAHIVRWIHV